MAKIAHRLLLRARGRAQPLETYVSSTNEGIGSNHRGIGDFVGRIFAYQ